MAKENKTLVIDESNIGSYSIADRDIVLSNGKKNKYGYPVVWPSKTIIGRRIYLSFVNATIEDLNGNKITEDVANFDILDREEFDATAKDADLKAKFILALISKTRCVKGGVYFNGEYYTGKLNDKKVDRLAKYIMSKYFVIDDHDVLLKYIDKDSNGLPKFWPTKTRDGRTVIFSAVNAFITKKDSTNHLAENVNFNIFKGDIFDLSKKEDKTKVETIRTLLDPNSVVKGFYYKGEILPESLSVSFKLYLEKTFIKKNFTVNDRDFLFTYGSKDSKSGFNLFWPMQDKSGRDIQISVVNASANWIDGEQYSNFDVYSDEHFDLTKEEFQIKMKIIQELLSQKGLVTGGLYFDGVLIPGGNKPYEIDRRKAKVEKALKIYIDDNEDFVRISQHFTTETAYKLLRLMSRAQKRYPNSKEKVPSIDKSFIDEPYVLKFDRVNVLDDLGNFLLEDNLSLVVKEGETLQVNDQVLTVIKAFFNPTAYVRGGIYFKGTRVSNKHYKNVIAKVFDRSVENAKAYILSNLNDEQKKEVEEYSKVQVYHFREDKKARMPIYWPTADNNGREVLVSVVDADVHFKVGRHVVRAANDMNFNVYVGETFGLVGESGSGKTTISRAILGINKLAKGGIYFKGKLISRKMPSGELMRTKKNIQMIFQDPAASLNERANVDYIVSEGLYNFHMFKSEEERIQKVTDMLGQVGLLPEHLSRYPHEFSGGQRQRIGIARALVIEPQLVLADEPISALDVSIRAQVLNLLRKLQKEQDLTYLFIAHDLSIIRYISDRIAVMHNGYVVENGPAEEIYENPLHPYTRSLLTAIPQPDPKTKDQRKKIPYVQGDIVYSECKWKDFGNGHYVLVNEKLDAEISAKVASSKAKSTKVVEAKVEEEAVKEVKKAPAKKVATKKDSATKKPAAKKTSSKETSTKKPAAKKPAAKKTK